MNLIHNIFEDYLSAVALPALRGRRIRFNGFFLNGEVKAGSTGSSCEVSKLLPELDAAVALFLFFTFWPTFRTSLPREGGLLAWGDVGLDRLPPMLKGAVRGLRCRIMDWDLPLTALELPEDFLLTPEEDTDLTGVEVAWLIFLPRDGVPEGLEGCCCWPEFFRGSLFTGL